MSGAPTSATSLCGAASFTWWRSWLGRAGMCWPGVCRTAWTRAFASRRSTTRWPVMAARRSSIPTRAASSPASPSPGACGRPASGSRWTAGVGCIDNIFIERLWRSLKYEAVYLRDLADGFEARRVIGEWIGFYNTERPHSALGGRTPAEAYRGDPPVDIMDKPLRALPTYPQAQQQRQEDLSREILAV